MADAELGDDVFGEDPTINRLRGRAAGLMGKDDGRLRGHRDDGQPAGPARAGSLPGEEIIADADAHIFVSGGRRRSAALGGIQVRQVPTATGVMSADQVARPCGRPTTTTRR